jgi:uncharacterized protein YrrD
MNLYRTEELLKIPMINAEDAQKLGDVSNIRIRLTEGAIYSYEFTQRVPLEESVSDENEEEIPAGNHYSKETSQIPVQTLRHSPHTTISGPILGAGGAFQEITHVYELKADQVHALSDDALLSKSNEYQKSDDKPANNGMSLDSIKGMKVITEQDQDLGKINDLLIDSKTQSIKGIELSEGFWKDLLAGKNQYIPFPEKMTLQDGNIIVPHDFEKRMVEHQIDLF